jgi:hypothetical protein
MKTEELVSKRRFELSGTRSVNDARHTVRYDVHFNVTPVSHVCPRLYVVNTGRQSHDILCVRDTSSDCVIPLSCDSGCSIVRTEVAVL